MKTRSVSIFAFKSCRDFLNAVLNERQSAYSSYSVRAFAKSLQLHHTSLSLVLRGKRNLSLERAKVIAEHLKLNTEEQEVFFDFIRLESAQDEKQKRVAKTSLQSHIERKNTLKLTRDQFSTISHWYYLPLLQMVKYSKDFQFSIETASIKLGLPESSIKDALKQLERTGLVKKENGTFTRTQERIVFSSQEKERLLQNYHRGMLRMATEQIGVGSPDEKYLGTETFAFDRSQIPLVHEILENAFNQILALSNEGQKKDSVYHLNISMFDLLKGALNENDSKIA